MNTITKITTGAMAGAIAVTGAVSAGTIGAPAAHASTAPAVKVVQNNLHHGWRASVRPTSFHPGNGLGINRIKWNTYNGTRAVGWGHFYGVNGTSSVKVTFTHPETRHGIRFFDHLFFQTVKMGGDSVWWFSTASYHGGF